MKSIKILIAGAVVILAANMLTGCTPKNTTVSEVGAQRIAVAQEMKKTVSLSPVATEDEKGITVHLLLSNPGKKPITSVQAWLSYNPEVLEGVSIDTQDSAFELMAPYTNDFDQNAGLMMLGRSTAKSVDNEEISIATIHFNRIGKGAAMIEAYDFRSDLEGHTSANMMVDGAPVNILLKPPTPLVTLNQ